MARFCVLTYLRAMLWNATAVALIYGFGGFCKYFGDLCSIVKAGVKILRPVTWLVLWSFFVFVVKKLEEHPLI